MTAFEWTMVVLTAAGFLATCLTGVVMVTRAVATIKQDVTEKIGAEALERAKGITAAVESRNKEMDAIRQEWHDSQKAQDHNIGELGLSLRRYIEAVEKEMRKIELWGRDNYVQKPELESVRSDIKTLGSDMKSMLGDLKADLKDDIKELKSELGRP